MRSRVRTVLAILPALLLAATAVLGQETQEQPSGPEPPPQEHRWTIATTTEVSAGAPQKLNAGLGLYVGRKTINPYGGTGFVLSAEPGLGGGKLSAGYGAVSVYGHSLVRATVLRTWGHPWHADPGKTYVGLEGQTLVFPILNSMVRAGVFRNGDGWLVSWSLGWSGLGPDF